MSATKHCHLCNTTKPLEDFYKTRNGKPRAGCKACHCAAASKREVGRYKKNPGAGKARHKRWRERHPEQFREIMRKAVAGQRRKKREAGTPELPLNLPPPRARRSQPTARAADDKPQNSPPPTLAAGPPASPSSVHRPRKIGAGNRIHERHAGQSKTFPTG